MGNTKWKDVTNKEICQICGGDTWCSISHDGSRAICRRQSSWLNHTGQHKTDKNGSEYWVFRLDRGPIERKRVNTEPLSKAEPELASAADRDQVYRYFLGLLPLYEQHKASLVARGFKESEIEKCLYKSHPGSGREQVAGLLVDKFGSDLCRKTPGVLFKIEDGQEYVTLAGSPGIFLPVANTHGQIVALHIRRDNSDNENRYIYFSSKSEGGPSSGTSIHVPQVTKKLDTATIRITEGGIKADLITAITDVLTISIPGVGNWKLAIETIKELKPKNVLIAFDADFRDKVSVARALLQLYDAIKALNIPLSIEVWDADQGKGIDDLLNNKGTPTVLPSVEAEKIIFAIREKYPESSSIELEPKPSWADVAIGFLKDKKWLVGNELLLRYWREDFYLWRGCSYRRLSRSDLRAEVVAYVQNLPLLRDKSGAKHGNEVLANIEAVTLISAEVEAPCWLTPCTVDPKFCVLMKNGILDVKAFLADTTEPLLPHSPNFFCLAHVPYQFDPKKKCPRFDQFIEEILPDSEVRAFLQEWFGYNLVHDTTHAKFVILVGHGANGKSVICIVLRTLLGEDNVSSVGLDQFSQERTFPIATTVGKLANIVEEMEEVTKASEGMLKNFVGGGVITLEKKYKDPFTAKATARATFATNSLPKLNDRTDGIWRRVVVVPFTVQILDEDKQDKRLIDPKFWIESGEIEGVFNFALAGLRRLQRRGAFAEPEKCRMAKRIYRQEMNLVGQFLNDFCETYPAGSIPSNGLYRMYQKWSDDHGFEISNNKRFTDELKRTFPVVTQSKNPLTQLDGSRSREWLGIRFIQHTQHT